MKSIDLRHIHNSIHFFTLKSNTVFFKNPIFFRVTKTFAIHREGQCLHCAFPIKIKINID